MNKVFLSLQTVPIAEVATEDRYDVTKVNGLTGIIHFPS